jgi:hypothetical protein
MEEANPYQSPSTETRSGIARATRAGNRGACSKEALATLLLRFLGVYFLTFGAIGTIDEAAHIVISASGVYSAAFVTLTQWLRFVRPIIELIVGAYFLTGGHWVYERMLAPMVWGGEEDTFDDVPRNGSEGPPSDLVRRE